MSLAITSGRPEGVWIIDALGRTVFANEAMAEILGTTPGDLMGKDSFRYVFPEDLAAAERLFEAKKAGSPAPFQFKLRRADGSAIRVDVQGTPMHNAAGHFTGIVGTFTVAEAQDRCAALLDDSTQPAAATQEAPS